MANWYVTEDGDGAQDGTSLANAFSASDFNTAGNWGASKIESNSVVYLSGTFTTRLAVQGSGANATSRIILTDTTANPATLVGINGSTFDYIAVIGLGFSQPDDSTAYSGIALSSGSTGWLIYRNAWDTTYYGGISGTTSNAIIRLNNMENIGAISLGFGGGSVPVCISINGDNNLVEYNSIIQGFDRTRVQGTCNIVRNNFWGAAETQQWTGTATLPNPNQYPHHTDAMQSFGTPKVQQLLYERNFDKDCGDAFGVSNCHGILIQDNTGGLGYNWFLHRFNIATRTGGGAVYIKEMDDTFFYNSTWVAQQLWATSSFFLRALIYENGDNDSDVADIRNITLTDSARCRESTGFYDVVSDVTNVTHGTNHTYNYGGSECAYPTGASPACLAKEDPEFTDPDNDDYTLGASSPLIGAGSSIIVAVGAGTDATELQLSVTHAKMICDGWGIADADWINFDGGSFIEVDSIDYANGVVTLATTATWSDGATVMVKGMEDVGALPYDYVEALQVTNTTNTTLAAGARTLTATSSSPESVRKVEFEVDGIPVGTANYSAAGTYSVNWTSDGAAHTVTAIAYNYWASETLTEEGIVLVNQSAPAAASAGAAPGTRAALGSLGRF